MMKLSLLVVLGCLAVSLADNRVSQRGLIHQIQKGVAGPNPYIFLTVPKGRSQALVQGFEVIEENKNKTDDEDDDEEEADNDDENIAEDFEENDDDDNDDELMDDDDLESDAEEKKNSLEKNFVDNDDAEDDDDDDDLDNIMSMNIKLRKSNPQVKEAKNTQLMVSRDHAGAILVPDGIIEIEGQSVIDEKTGKPAVILPRAVLDSIPDGSIVALMERFSEDEAEARVNRVIVRRRRKGVRRNIKRRRGGNKRRVVKRRYVTKHGVNNRGGTKRRRNNKRKNVHVVRRGNRRSGNKRRVNRRRVSQYA